MHGIIIINYWNDNLGKWDLLQWVHLYLLLKLDLEFINLILRSILFQMIAKICLESFSVNTVLGQHRYELVTMLRELLQRNKLSKDLGSLWLT